MLAQQQVDKHLGVVAPKAGISAQYGTQSVSYGNVINAEHLLQPPSKITWPCKPNALYTLILVDLDAPSKKLPEDRELRHWVVCNIPENDINQGSILTEYEAPSPPVGTGLHRFVFLAYEQKDFVQNETLGNRNNWKANEFAKKHNMTLSAGNYFQTQVE